MWSKGQSLIEVIVATTVGVLVVSALTFAVIFSLRNAKFSQNQNQATKLAQEGIERVRSGRDRNEQINGLVSVTDCPTSGTAVNSWNGNTSGSSIWNCKIYNAHGSGGNAYFKFSSGSNNNLSFLITASSIPNPAELIPPFNRGIILSDDVSTYSTQKKVTVIVQWTDSTGSHESKLTTILRRL